MARSLPSPALWEKEGPGMGEGFTANYLSFAQRNGNMLLGE